MKKPKEHTATCEACLYWKEMSETADEYRWGSCRRYPPTAFIDEELNPFSVFPPVEPTEVCGEFRGRQ